MCPYKGARADETKGEKENERGCVWMCKGERENERKNYMCLSKKRKEKKRKKKKKKRKKKKETLEVFSKFLEFLENKFARSGSCDY